MDPRTNPYSPGAGLRPAALAGRESELEAFEVAMHRARAGRSAQSMILHGLRGVGKTVLLNELANVARSKNWIVGAVEADLRGARTPFGRQLSRALSDGMREQTGAGNLGERMKRALATFKSFSVSVFGTGASLELQERGATGTLTADLTDLVLDLAAAAQDIDTGIAVFIDEMQHLEQQELAAISQACHAANQRNLPFVVVGAGLSNLPRVLSEAVSYAERLYDYRSVGRLADDDARAALELPAQAEGVEWDQGAVEVVLAASGGYPYFIQQFGQTSWNESAGSPIEPAAAHAGVRLGREMLDNGFFRARWDRATPAEREFMSAMAADGEGPSESGEVARRLGKRLNALGPARANLIAKGLVWAPEHGQIAFSVPGMAEFIAREVARS